MLSVVFLVIVMTYNFWWTRFLYVDVLFVSFLHSNTRRLGRLPPNALIPLISFARACGTLCENSENSSFMCWMLVVIFVNLAVSVSQLSVYVTLKYTITLGHLWNQSTRFEICCAPQMIHGIPFPNTVYIKFLAQVALLTLELWNSVSTLESRNTNTVAD